MLEQDVGEGRLVQFLAVLAGLLGVVYSVFPFTPGILGNFPMRDLVAGYLLFFMAYSAVAYASLTMGRRGARNLAYGSLALFSILLAVEFALALFQIVSDSALFVFSFDVLAFFAVALGVFFVLYYLLARVVGSASISNHGRA